MANHEDAKTGEANARAARKPALSTKEQLDAQEKRRIRIPLRQGMDPEKAKQLFVPVQVNGYTYQIMPGEWVEVPETVAQILAEANYI